MFSVGKVGPKSSIWTQKVFLDFLNTKGVLVKAAGAQVLHLNTKGVLISKL